MAKDKTGGARVTVRDTHMGWFFFTAYFGALVYFVQNSEGFWGFIFSFIQAAIWPAYILHEALKLLNIQ